MGAVKGGLLLGTEMGREISLVGVRGYRVARELGDNISIQCVVVARNELTWGHCWLAGYRRDAQVSQRILQG